MKDKARACFLWKQKGRKFRDVEWESMVDYLLHIASVFFIKKEIILYCELGTKKKKKSLRNFPKRELKHRGVRESERELELLALHVADLGMIPCTLYDPLSSPVVISKSRASN